MTTLTYQFEQKRLDNFKWSGGSKLSGITALANDEKGRIRKQPLFYLETVSVDSYEDDIYFVNNTNETLSWVAPFKPYRNITEARAKLGDTSDENLRKVTLYSDDINSVYQDVLPKQGVRIGSTHIMYDSDAMMQWFIHVPYKGPDTHYAIWQFNVVEKGGIRGTYPLVWDDFSKPSHMVNCDCLFDQADMPIEVSIYEERCAMLDRLIGSFGISNAIFILAINDVLYRYGVGWSAPYSESDIQAQDIAMKLIEQKPENAKAVKAVVQAVYDFWFNEGFAKNISVQACEELLSLYQAHVATQKPV
ncbi:hypothetical protein [Psychrobacter sp. Ps2]|uniref:hypothetical protein n=1 Tax=Psychrobacter sp. Ps2 TaxID=2790956 RepID=UPI001EDEEFA0|nr:hypothetical protein [Psychrobacter sp. Ps2]MCG3858695.1 hypothetical protein [Psychrobacter sp. Ps2]